MIPWWDLTLITWWFAVRSTTALTQTEFLSHPIPPFGTAAVYMYILATSLVSLHLHTIDMSLYVSFSSHNYVHVYIESLLNLDIWGKG